MAAVFSVSDELSEDAPFLIASIQRQVTIAVLAAENAAVVSALASASGVLTGTGTKAAAIDVLAAAIGVQETASGTTPSAVLMSPSDIAVIRAAKASTGGSYILDPLLAGPTTLHGVPLTSTASVPSGTAYLVSAGAGVFYRRGPLRVESGFTEDDWVRNILTVRVEERVLPAVVSPELVSKLTLTRATLIWSGAGVPCLLLESPHRTTVRRPGEGTAHLGRVTRVDGPRDAATDVANPSSQPERGPRWPQLGRTWSPAARLTP